MVRNIGTDGSGQNCGMDRVYMNQVVKNDLEHFKFHKEIQEDILARKRLKDFILKVKPTLYIRFKNRLKSIVGVK